MTVYVGTYTNGASKGIYTFQFDSSTGKTTEPTLAAESSNPTFLAVHPKGQFLYAANENANGTVSAFAIGEQFTFLNSVSSCGDAPCHIAIDRTGKWLFVANYNSGSVAVFPLSMDGKLGAAVTFVQHSGSSPHPHQVAISADNKSVLVPDLGNDQVVIYGFDDTIGTLGTPSFVNLAQGAGPRHLVFGSQERFVYVLNERAASITTFSRDFASQQTVSMLPADYDGNKSGAEIVIHPNGKTLYASNRGHDSIAMFRIDPTGFLTAAGHISTQGKTPRNFAIDPTGGCLLAANQDSGTIVIFAIDPNTGGLKPSGQAVQVPTPVSIVFA